MGFTVLEGKGPRQCSEGVVAEQQQRALIFIHKQEAESTLGMVEGFET